MLWGRGVSIVEVTVAPLTIPLREPFVIASGRLDATRAALVRATLEDDRGRRATGLGESAALPPVTREDQPELLQLIATAAAGLRGVAIARDEDLDGLLAGRLPGGGVARAGVETAILDAAARLQDLPLYRALGGTDAPAMLTDITLSISDPERMAAAATRHARAGFTCFKVKVGRDWRADCASLRAVAAAVPGARFRLDANAGFTATEALALLDTALADGLAIECFEQPLRRRRSRGDGRGHRARAGAGGRRRILPRPRRSRPPRRRAGGRRRKFEADQAGRSPRRAGARPPRARRRPRLMAGAMVETRVGLLAMAHVVAALGGVDWVDLDTAFLLAEDPYTGGWEVDGPRIRLTDEPGLGVDTQNVRLGH